MRGQYRVWISGITIGTTEAPICTIIIPALTKIEINRVELIGAASTSTRVTWQMRRISSGTPSVTGAAIPKAVEQDNAFPSSVSFGTGWSAAPGVYDSEPVISGQLEAYGGRDVLAGSLQEVLAHIGASTQQRYDITAIASASVSNCALRITFTE